MSIINQSELQHKIEDYICSFNFKTAHNYIQFYRNNFGNDNFSNACLSFIMRDRSPLISLICINSNPDEVNSYVREQLYNNIEIFCTSSDDWENDIFQYINLTTSKYICFYESDHVYDVSKILTMVSTEEFHPELDGIICTRNFITTSHSIIAHQNYYYQGDLTDKTINASQLIEYCIEKNENLYGNLSTLLLSTSYIRKLQLTSQSHEVPASMRTLAFLYQLLWQARVGYIYVPLAATILKDYINPSDLQKDYSTFLMSLYKKGKFHQLKQEHFPKYHQSRHISCDRDITFFYTDKSEYYNLKPIADEAEKRGYKITFTKGLEKKAEIGVYCQHICFIHHPENSRFSVILLHDIGQGQTIWPNHWEGEKWNGFDIGILPGRFWADFWSQCACQYYANPRCGVFELGYPKSDLVNSDEIRIRTDELRRKLNLKYNMSVLYAPSWENDGKEHDFVTALSSLPVNLLIKQAPDMEKYPAINENVKQMRNLHEGKYDNVYYIEPEENIMHVFALCDIVVSDESGAMSEAVMFGKPSIAIMDWLIPDTTPSRFSCVPMDYIIKCRKPN